MLVRIEWFGHSFLRVEAEGRSLVFDPHDGGSLNLPVFRVEGDALLITHNHYDHNAEQMVEAGETFRWRRGDFEAAGFPVRGILSYHDKAEGSLRGENTIYVADLGGVRIAHLGDLGHLPDADLIGMIGRVDVLMIPVGGVYTIDAYEAWLIVQALGPKIVVPMHFWMPNMTVPLDPLERFLDTAKTRRLRLESNLLEFEPEDLPEKTTTVVFRLPREQ